MRRAEPYAVVSDQFYRVLRCPRGAKDVIEPAIDLIDCRVEGSDCGGIGNGRDQSLRRVENVQCCCVGYWKVNSGIDKISGARRRHDEDDYSRGSSDD